MTTAMHSGEITSLADAIAFADSGSDYCDQIGTPFEEAQTQARATSEDVQHMLAVVENAQSSLAGEGLTEIAGQLGGMQEELSTLLTAMQEVEQHLAHADESVNTMRAVFDQTHSDLQEQQGVAEEISGHREVATETRFYQDA